MRMSFGEELFDYCKYECPRKLQNKCKGMRLNDTPMYNIIKHNPTLSSIVGNFHTIHPPCDFYNKIANLKDNIDQEDFEMGNVNRIRRKYDGDIIELRKRTYKKPITKRKRCKCK